jgi:hypothetical protein
MTAAPRTIAALAVLAAPALHRFSDISESAREAVDEADGLDDASD